MTSAAIRRERTYGAAYAWMRSRAGTEDDAAQTGPEPKGKGAIGKRMNHEHSVPDSESAVYSREL